MQSRLVTMEEGKEQSSSISTLRTNQSTRSLPFKFLQIFLLFLLLGLGFSIFLMHMVRYLGFQNIPTISPPPPTTTILSCFQEPNSMENWIRPPTNLWHTMNDTELLWRASYGSKTNEYPFKRVPKVAFMFLTKGPLPLAPLWERFFKGHGGFYSIYLHALPSYVAEISSSSVFYRRNIPSQIVQWGEMSMCDAERRLLANALLDISNEWFVLLSEACIPLHNFDVTYRYLSRSRHSFMGSYDDPGPYGRGRYNTGMEPEVKLGQWRKGSQWFETNRKLAISIVEDDIYYPKFKEFCKPACYVDEHYFPTMLTIQSSNLLANRSLTWTDWSRGGAHPATFGKTDITERFLKKISDGPECFYNNQPSTLCYLFARKFAPSSLEPLLELSFKVFGF